MLLSDIGHQMASDDNRISFRLDEETSADVAAAMRFLGIRNKSDFLRQAIATEIRRTKREMAIEGEIRAVAEDQAPYGQGTGSGLARRESTPTSEPAGDLDDYPAVRAVKQVLAELEAKRAAEQQGPAPRPEPTTGSR